MLIREIMYCKPGKVRQMVEKSLTMARLMEKSGQGRMRVMTDFVGEQYWTAIMEFEVKDLRSFEDMMSGKGMSRSRRPGDGERHEGLSRPGRTRESAEIYKDRSRCPRRSARVAERGRPPAFRPVSSVRSEALAPI